MQTKMFSVYDSKGKMFNTPFFMPTIGMAIRAFQDLAKDQNTSINKHPEDYLLYEIADYDDSDATIKQISPIKLISTAIEHIQIKAPILSEKMTEMTKEIFKNTEKGGN